MTDPIRPSSITIRETSPRMTPPPPSQRFGEVLAQGGRALLQGAVTAVSFVPGGNIVAAAIRGAPLPLLNGAASPGGGTAEAPSPGAASGGGTTGTMGGGGTAAGDDDVLARGQEMSMRMLRLQEAIGEENRRYTALSNVLHARHEMAKNAIGNIR